MHSVATLMIRKDIVQVKTLLDRKVVCAKLIHNWCECGLAEFIGNYELKWPAVLAAHCGLVRSFAVRMCS